MCLDGIKSLDDYLQKYGQHLADRARESLRPLHTPGVDPVHPVVAEFIRAPFEAQAHVITGAAKALKRDKGIFIVGEMGTGKTLMGECGVHAHANGRPYRALIFCPGHLPEKWKREIQQTIAGAKVKIIAHWTDALKLWENRKVPPTGPEWFIVSQNTAKLGAKWNALKGTKIRGVDHVVMKCPACGHVQRDKQDVPLMAKAFAGKMKFCEGKVTNPLRAKGERVCGQALWTYNATLRKWDAARFFHKKMHHFFDYFIVDEVHEEKGDATAQATAMGACIAASKRVVALTGTLIGGYAEHLRPLLFRICPRTLVEEGLKWTDSMLFAERYGKIETRISTRSGGSDSGDEGKANKQSRGSSGGRSVTRVIRPGIMPTIFGRHLMGNTVFLLLDEVAENLPELEESIVRVPMDGHLKVAYEAIESKLADAIKSLIKSKGPGGAGKLLGPMLNALLCYPDHPFDWKPIGYTDRDDGFIMVAEPETLDVDRVYAKEQALIDDVLADYRMGRQCWVFCEYNGEHNVQGRMADMLRNQGLRVTELRANIPLVDREAWIAKNGPNYDVILSNPNLVKTGLDLFDKGGKHNFSSLFFYETGTNLFTLRQASRRAWRIGQMAKCKVKYYFYEETMQERIMALMGKKMAAATAIDGRFTTEGLVGMAEDDSIEVAMAKSLADNMQEDASRHWAKIGAGEGPTISMDGGDGFFDDLASFLDSVAL